ncbi:MAG: fibronectin type III domain-containing protein, partial [Phycisphaerales bacterium]|nr:fibronectin type III domain-containing protein [Phycisphaerales bacterium]
MSVQTYKTYTVRGLDNAYVTLDAGLASDGISLPQGGDGDTTATTAGGRACRTTASSADVNFYFKCDDGYAYDRAPGTIYLQVDYYGASGSITPYYDGIDGYEEPLQPVYLSGGTTWRTATWKIEKVNFGHRIGSQLADFRLYVGNASGVVHISSVRLSYGSPSGMLAQPQNLAVAATSTTQTYLSWAPVPGATKYQVCRGGAAVVWPTAVTFADTGLSPNTQYAYAVTAYDDAGNTSFASVAKYVTTLSIPPSSSTFTFLPQPGVWQTFNYTRVAPVGGFGPGKVAYYQYIFDESPTHRWTGNEGGWPGITPPSSAGWTVWRATSSPTDEDNGWLLY